MMATKKGKGFLFPCAFDVTILQLSDSYISEGNLCQLLFNYLVLSDPQLWKFTEIVNEGKPTFYCYNNYLNCDTNWLMLVNQKLEASLILKVFNYQICFN